MTPDRARFIIGTAALLLGSSLSAPGAWGAPVPYRDEMFTQIATTTREYGRSVDSQGVLQSFLLDVHDPVENTEPRRPAVVWVHGGFFIRGDRTSEVQSQLHKLTRAGYVTISIDYRLHHSLPEGALDIVLGLAVPQALEAVADAQHDAQGAVRWARANAAEFRIDPDRIAIAGKSAGGITATSVLFNSHDPGDNDSNPGVSSRVAAGVSLSGGGVPGLTAQIDLGEPPLMTVHGAADDVVPYPVGLLPCVVTVALLNACEHVVDPDQDHGTFGMEEARDFLYRRVARPKRGLLPFSIEIVGLPPG